MTLRFCAWSVAMAALLGCDAEPAPDYLAGDGVEIGGASSVELGCERYCNASFSAGCPPASDGCADACVATFRGTCEQKLADYLACIPERLTPGCLVGLDDICGGALRALEQCQYCGDGSAALVGVSGCESDYACGLAARCDDDGFCNCFAGDTLIGNCQAMIGGIDACLPATSCCTRFL